MMRLRWSPAGLVGLIVVAGCGGSAGDAVVDRTPVSEQTDQVAVEMAGLRASVDESVARCMREAGYPSFPKSKEQHLAGLRELYSIGLAIVDPALAESEGYGVSEEPAAEEVRYFDSLTDAESDAYQSIQLGDPVSDVVEFTTPSGLTGSLPVGGCTGDAASEVYGSVENYRDGSAIFYELQDMMSEVTAAVEADDRFVDALAAWGECMADAGQQFSTPNEAREQALTSRTDSDEGLVSDSERAIAVADAGCQEKGSLSEVYFEVALDHQSRLESKRSRVFLGWGELMDRVEEQRTAADGSQEG